VQTYEIDLGSFSNCLGQSFTVSGLLYKGVAPTGNYASLASISGPAVGTNKYTLTVNDAFLADETVVYSLQTFNAADPDDSVFYSTDHFIYVFVQSSSQTAAKIVYTPRSIKECPLYEYPLFFGPNEATTIHVYNFDVDSVHWQHGLRCSDKWRKHSLTETWAAS